MQKKNWFRWHETDRFLNNQSGMCACLPQHPWLFIFSSRGHDRQSSDQNFSSRGHARQSSEQNNRKLVSLHNNGDVDKHAHGFAGNIFRLETCMNSLAKVPPYSKLNFQGKIFFTQNWCNITLRKHHFLNRNLRNWYFPVNEIYLKNGKSA